MTQSVSLAAPGAHSGTSLLGSSYLDLEELGAARASLLSAALACSDFCSPALDALWRTIDNLTPLLKLLPAVKLVEGVYTLSGLVRASDWTIFQSYAARVRRVVYRGGVSVAGHSSLYSALASGNRPLIPNLTTIRFLGNFVTTGSPFPEAFLLISSTIRHVEISALGLDDISTTSFLATLAHTADHISSLVIQTQQSTVFGDPQALSQSLQDITLLDMRGDLQPHLLRALSQLPRLVSLSIEFKFVDFPGVLAYIMNGIVNTPFAALKKLRVRCCSNAVLSIFFIVIPRHALETLIIDGTGKREIYLPWNTTITEDILDRWPTSLRRLEITDLVCALERDPTPCVELRRLRNLEVFVLRNCSALSFEGLTLPEIAGTLPALTTLAIPGLAGVSLGGLATLAESCPLLFDLEVTLAADPLPALGIVPAAGQALRTLNVGASPCPQGLELLAHHLDLVFPRLCVLRAEGVDETRWAQVQTLIGAKAV
ncbi:hypothetical protein B0H15DRAFT_866731 [Mycena belliarum]|uniref:Uncharacterized protein n=1 Tax=Mycena belliarum TaxID=1033014 RepID=A0AAD6TPN7_9AGAR|nr:hypothetical protein B0H15DRAFT_866731 [Mycena belliae]